MCLTHISQSLVLPVLGWMLFDVAVAARGIETFDAGRPLPTVLPEFGLRPGWKMAGTRAHRIILAGFGRAARYCGPCVSLSWRHGTSITCTAGAAATSMTMDIFEMPTE